MCGGQRLGTPAQIVQTELEIAPTSMDIRKTHARTCAERKKQKTALKKTSTRDMSLSNDSCVISSMACKKLQPRVRPEARECDDHHQLSPLVRGAQQLGGRLRRVTCGRRGRRRGWRRGRRGRWSHGRGCPFPTGAAVLLRVFELRAQRPLVTWANSTELKIDSRTSFLIVLKLVSRGAWHGGS